MTSNHNIGFHFKRKLLFSRIYSLQKLSIKADLKVAFVKTKAKLLKKTGKAVYQLQTCNCVKVSVWGVILVRISPHSD